MELTATQKRKLREAAQIIASGVGIALLYPAFSDDWKNTTPFLNAFFIGLIGGVVIAIIEVEVFDPQKKRRSFLVMFSVKTILYFLFFAILVPSVMVLNESLYYNRGVFEHFQSEQFQNFLFQEDYSIILIYAFIFIAIIIFTRQISRKLGQGILLNYVFGRYHHPQEVERIFMYLDLRSSTTIAEQIGEFRFHNFIRDFFYDITNCIVMGKGKIYRYVGDQVVVSWKMTDGLENANCLQTYFYVKNQLKHLREKYVLEYGFAPKFSTSFHCGEIVIGEIGTVKSEIVYHGEVLHQLAAIEKLHGKLDLDENILISEMLIKKIVLPQLYKVILVGEITLSTQHILDVYSLREINH